MACGNEFRPPFAVPRMAGGEVSWAAHKNLLRLKVATGLAFLHESPRVETEHVYLADLVIADSLRVQRDCERLARDNDFKAQVMQLSTVNRVAEVVGDRKLSLLVASAKKKLQTAAGSWVAWSDIRPAYRDRAEWSEQLWDALVSDLDVVVDTELKARRARWRDVVS